MPCFSYSSCNVDHFQIRARSLSNNSLRTALFVIATLVVMFASYWFLPVFPRLKPAYSSWVFSACWACATVASVIPIAVKQQIFSNRFWYGLIVVSMIGTWGGFTLLYWWYCAEAKRSAQFPGLGAGLFFIVAAGFSGLLSFAVGWLVPTRRRIPPSQT